MSLFFVLTCFSQTRTTITVTGDIVTVGSYNNNEVIVNGATELHITATTNLLYKSIVKLNSVDSWLFIDNQRPQYVLDSLLSKIYINDQLASYRSNCRVAIYKHGAVVIPQSSTFQPLTVFKDQNFSGESSSAISQFVANGALSGFDNSIRSFKLKRGYMVTFATSSDGMGYSRVFIADSKDLEVPILPDLLDKKISYIRVMQWEWPTKKGWCGSNTAEYIPLNTTWRYDWSAAGNTTTSVEYVPIRQNGSWPGWDEIGGKSYVTHVLGFNEPDHTEQSNLTVTQAVAQWPNMMKTGLRIGSPACTNFSWLYQFMDSCKAKNYRVDYVAVHAYWGGKSPQNWYNDLKYIHDRTGRPLWITEWNNGANWTTESWPTSDHSLSTENAAKQLNDIKAILQVLDTAHFIERYSIYNWVQDCRAMVLNGNLTPAGQYYANNKSVMAYNPINEVIPTFVYGNPSLNIAFGTKNLTLIITDPNFENFVGAVVERKIDDGEYAVIYDTDTYDVKTFSDNFDITSGVNKVRYRIRSKLANGSLSIYSNEVGYDVTSGSDNIQYGKLSAANVGWNSLFF
ncbi:MAG: glycosyl hydrolase [Paludibacteraceae bacterium]